MADSSLLQIVLQYFNATAQNVPTLNFAPATYATPAPTKNYQSRIVAAITNTTLNLSAFATTYALAVKNLDSTNFAEMTWVYTDATSVDHTNVVRIPAGGLYLSTSTIKVASNLIFLANTAPVSLDVALIGI